MKRFVFGRVWCEREYKLCVAVSLLRRTDTLCVENITIGRNAPWSHDFIQVC